MTDAEILDIFEGVKYLYLRDISEPDKQAFNTLAIVAEEAVVNRGGLVMAMPERPELGAVLRGAHPIESIEGCRTFRLYWKNYIAYMVTEEMAASTSPNGESDECYTGKLFRSYSKSYFLEFMNRNTGGRDCKARHYRLVCLDHIIDVASCFPPQIEVIGANTVPLRTQ